MTLKVYPSLPGLTFPILKAAEFDTLVSSAPNKYETRLGQTVNPIWSWELIYDFIRNYPTPTFGVGELRTLLDFFLYQGGQSGEFLFLDPDDNCVGPAIFVSTDGGFGEGGFGEGPYGGVTPNPLAALQVVTDGNGNYFSPLQRTFGGLFYEDITDLNTDTTAGGSALGVFVNGVQVGATGYTGPTFSLEGPGLALPSSSYMGLYLAWSEQPSGPVTAQFNFYFRVRFETDSQDMEKFARAFWTIGGSESQKGTGQIKLVQVRPTPL